MNQNSNQPKESDDWEETIRGIGCCGGHSPEGVPSREHDDSIIDIIRSLKSRWQSEARVKERLGINSMLHDLFMESTDKKELDLIEKIQQKILNNPTHE